MGIFSKRRRKSSLSPSNALLRWFGPGSTVLGLLYAAYLFLTGGLSFSSLDQWLGNDKADDFRGEVVSLGNQSERPPDGIRIATFNIENFSVGKADKREENSKYGVDVLGTLARVISTFDLVAIQEIRGKHGKAEEALSRLIQLLNASEGTHTYTGLISELIGNDDRWESYAFIWDHTRIRFIEGSDYVVLDPGGKMYREPMVASFEALLPRNSTQRPFRFTLINVHTDPDEVDPNRRDSEINVLADVFQRVREYEYQNSGEVSIAGDIGTNVSGSKTNDHILYDRNVTAEYAGRTGVINLVEAYGLTPEQAEEVSDHIPLWAEFNHYEKSALPQTNVATPAPRTRLIK